MIKQALFLLVGICLFSLNAQAQEDKTEAVLGEFKYTTTMSKQNMEFDVERTITMEDGKMMIVDKTSTPFGNSENTSVIDAESMMTLSQSSTGFMTSNIDYTGERIVGETADFRGNKTPIDVEKGEELVYGGGNAMEPVLTALPLEVGYETTISTFTTFQMEVIPMKVMVAEKESVEVPGGTFEAYRLDITIEAFDEFEQSIWISAENPRMVLKSLMIAPQMGEMTTVYAGKKEEKKKKKKKKQ